MSAASAGGAAAAALNSHRERTSSSTTSQNQTPNGHGDDWVLYSLGGVAAFVILLYATLFGHVLWVSLRRWYQGGGWWYGLN